MRTGQVVAFPAFRRLLPGPARQAKGRILMPSSQAARLRDIADKIRRLPERFTATGLRPSQWLSWMHVEGANLVMEAFTKAGAYGGPLPDRPDDSPPRLTTRATDAERRAYVRGTLSCYAAWYPWPHVVTVYAWGVRTRAHFVWETLEVFAPEPRPFNGYKSTRESAQEYIARIKYRGQVEAAAVANAIEAEADLIDGCATAPPLTYVTDEDWRILTALDEAHPKLLTQEQIEGASGMQVAVRTIHTRLVALADKGLVCRPEGKRSGYRLTPAGFEAVKGRK
jgi:hypothetical protein